MGAGWGGGAGAASFFCAGVGAAAAGADFAGVEDSPSAEMVPTMVFTCTVLPSATLISCNTPEAGAGISASTLSVEISKSGSSRWTLSPGFLSHLVIVPSKMDSPIWGIMTSVGIISFHAAHWDEFRSRHKLLLYIEMGMMRTLHGPRLRVLEYRVLIRAKAKTAEGVVKSGRSPIERKAG